MRAFGATVTPQGKRYPSAQSFHRLLERRTTSGSAFVRYLAAKGEEIPLGERHRHVCLTRLTVAVTI